MAPLRTAHPELTSTDLRAALGRFATGVTVVTSISGDGRPAGTTVSAFSALSLDPPLVIVSLTRKSQTLRAVHSHGALTVNVLADGDQAVSNAFARTGNDAAWDLVDHRPGTNGAPVLESAHVALECTVEQVLPGGDHEIVVGRVTAVREGDPGGEPLLHYSGRYGQLASTDAGALLAQAAREAEAEVRRRAEVEAAECALPTRSGDFRLFAHERDAHDLTALLVHGDPSTHPAPVISAHEACLLGDVLGSLACDCGARLEESQREIVAAGAGAIVYTKRSGADTFLCAAGSGPDLSVGAGLLRRAGVDPALLLARKPDQDHQDS